MNIYEIYHAIDIMAMLVPDPQNWLTARRLCYRYVATIQAELDQVFAMTQHTDGRNWTERSEVTLVTSGLSPRSTSVGDVIYSPETALAWLVGHSSLEEIKGVD